MMVKLFLLTALVAGLLDFSSAHALRGVKLRAIGPNDTVAIPFEKTFRVVPSVARGTELIFFFANCSFTGVTSFTILGDWSKWESESATVYLGVFGADQLALQCENVTTSFGFAPWKPILGNDPAILNVGNIRTIITYSFPRDNPENEIMDPYVIPPSIGHEVPTPGFDSVFYTLINVVEGLKEKLNEKLSRVIAEAFQSLLLPANEEEIKYDENLKNLMRALKKSKH